MSFVTQEDVFAAMEPVMHGIFESSPRAARSTPAPFRRIPYAQAMLDYGSDKPDLRNPLVIRDVTAHFAGSGFGLFARIAASGGVVRAIPAPGAAANPRAFFDKLNEWAREQGAGGLGYIAFDADGAKGPIAKQPGTRPRRGHPRRLRPGPRRCRVLRRRQDATMRPKFAGQVRLRLGHELGLVEQGRLPLLLDRRLPHVRAERGDRPDRLQPQPLQHAAGRAGGAEDAGPPRPSPPTSTTSSATATRCASGAIRNHKAEIMLRAFEIAGYPPQAVEDRFGGMLNAFRYGAPPHGGMAAGIDRIVMLLADEPNLREVNLFPMNQQGEDLMMGAPFPGRGGPAPRAAYPHRAAAGSAKGAAPAKAP